MTVRGIGAGLRRGEARAGGRGVWLATASMLCSVACLTGGSAGASVALGAESSSSAGIGGGGALGGLLVTQGSPVAGEQVRAAEEARRSDPEAVADREASRTKFEGLNSQAASKLAGEVFPAMIDTPADGPVQLPAGESVAGYLSNDVARIRRGDGKYGLVESLEPIDVEASPGRRVPVDLSLTDTGSAFQPTMPSVEVRIPKRLGSGVQLGNSGVSMTPVREPGVPLGGSEGALDGAGVFYASTQADTDTVVKPTALGFEVNTLLRSVASPQQLSFEVGLPQGASLIQRGRDGAKEVEVLGPSGEIAVVSAPSAQDAAGRAVPVSLTVSGDTLTLTVDHRAAQYQYPISVDPIFEETDEQLTGSSKPTNWKFEPEYSEHFKSSGWGGSELTLESTGTYKAGETGFLSYQTQGDSKIYEARVETSGSDQSSMETYLTLANSTKVEDPGYVATGSYSKNWYGVCASWESNHEADCNTPPGKYPSEYGAEHNWVHFGQAAIAGGSGSNVDNVYKAQVEIAQEHEPETPTFNTANAKIGARENILYGQGGWLGPYNGAFEVHDKDPGIGISWLNVDTPFQWHTTREFFNEGRCRGVQCLSEVNEPFTYTTGMVDGEDNVEVLEQDLAMNGAYGPVGQHKIKVDATPPYNLEVTGLPANGLINEQQFHLHAKATDGKAPTSSSGVKMLELGIDGYTLPGKSGQCIPGPCTVSGEWTINGETLGAGKHTLTLVATDYAGNKEKKEYSITVRHAGPLPVGPGSVNPIGGALHLSASDVSIGGGQGSLGISRSYDSRQLSAGEEGPLGPQWSISVDGSQFVEQEATGSVALVNSGGGRTLFESNGKGGYIPPKGDENLVLEAEKEGATIKAYLLKDPAAGTTVRYTQPGGAGPWVMESSEGALSKTNGEKEAVEWTRVEGATRPRWAVAPAPAGISCPLATAWEIKGCRTLEFTYATATTATGEAPSEWKAYKNRLEKVSLRAYNPSTKTMADTAVAEYAYDSQGRLRAEWDPRISPALKTTYGYDSEGHVVAVNPAGQEPSLFHYGTTASDPSAGRLLSITRPPAGSSTQLKEQNERAAPVNTAAPTLSSTSPVVGATLSVSGNGSWSNSPLAYSYAWQDCHTYESKETCTAIPGAVDGTYTPQASDAGYTLRAQVTAVNADGAGIGTTAASNALAGVAPAYHLQFGKVGEAGGQFKAPAGDAIDSSGNVWVADSTNSRVQELSASGTFIKAIGWGVSNGKAEFEICTSSCKAGTSGSGAGQFSKPEGIAINTNKASPSYGDVYVLDSGNNRVEELNSEGKYVGTFGKYGKEPEQLNAPEGITVVPAGALTSSTSNEVWVGDSGNDRVDEFSETGEYLGSFGSEGSGAGQFKSPDGIAFSGENAYVVDSGNNRVQEFSLSGQYVAQFGSSGSGEGQFATPDGIATEPVSGDLYVTDSANSRIEEFNPVGVFLVAYGKKGEGGGQFSGPDGIAINSAGDAYVADTGNNRVQELEPKYSTNDPLPEPPALGTSSVTTVEYNVPVSGSGAPHEMIKAELEKWGQKEEPKEATAIFPADEPMGWPAKDYKRATIVYLNELGHTVNRATPSGGISTSEYNEANEIIRSLSADNRQTALNAGATSKEVSEKLDTKSKYNGETKEEKEQEEKEKKSEAGSRLLETTGPEHKIRLTNGTEVQARNHVRYFYDEGAPEKETFNLATKTIDSAWYEGKDHEERTTTTSYSGQSGLGWILRKPTSVTTDPSGLNLVQTTVYDPGTGKALETQRPPESPTPAYLARFGKYGTAGPELESPKGVAVAPNGNVYVLDAGNNRVTERTAGGTFVMAFGYGVSNGEAKYETCTTSCQAGIAGAGNGQFSGAEGIAVGPNGTVYVSERSNDRVQEFSASGEYVGKFGSVGTAEGQFKEPHRLAVAPNGNVYVADYYNNRVQEFSSSGAFIETFGWGVSNGESKLETCTSGCKAGKYGLGNGQFLELNGIAVAPNGNVYVTDGSTNDRVQEFSPTGEFLLKFGSKGTESGKFEYPQGLAVSAGGNVYVVDRNNYRVQEFSESGSYVTQFGSKGSGGGQFESPYDVAIGPNGYLDVVAGGVTGGSIQEWRPLRPGNQSARDTKTIYYTAGTNSESASCGNHPEWAELPCQSQPVAQSGTAELPDMPVVTNETYNLWDEPEKLKENFEKTGKFAAVTRTKTMTYDGAGRLLTNEETSSPVTGTTLPKVTDKYSTETGGMVEQSTRVGETTTSIKSVYNTLGQLTEYTDADGNTTQYIFSGPANDDQLEEVNYGGKKGSQMYSYDPTTKALTKLLDVGPEGGAGAGTFTASYDVEGKMTSEAYPNGMTAKYTFNSTGEAVGIEYEKTTDCTEKCILFSETIVPSIHGETLQRTSTLATEEYGYDNGGRLTSTFERPAGKSCRGRLYVYNEDSDRTSKLSTPECPSGGEVSENHEYDTAGRLIDPGTEYETFGNQTKIPAVDAGGNEITASFYVDNQVASQKQNGETINYKYDPAGRPRETVSQGTSKSTVIDHYPGSGEAISWTSEEEGKKWTREIPSIDGTLSATQSNGEAAVLQLHDLRGDIVATAGDKETETKLLSTYNPTEFGVPANGTPPKYSWLGASGQATELPSGATASGGAGYVPQLGAPLQTQPIAPPGTPGGSYAGGIYTSGGSTESLSQGLAYGEGAPGREAARQEAIRQEAEKRAAEGVCNLASCQLHGPENIPSPGEGGAEGEGGGEPPSLGPGEWPQPCQPSVACDSSRHMFGPNSCHFPWVQCHIDLTMSASAGVVGLVYPHREEELYAIGVGCGIIGVAGSPIAGVVCAAALGYYWFDFKKVVEYVHEFGGCISLKYSLGIIDGFSSDSGSGCIP